MTIPKRQLFGTDGIRAVAGEYPLDAKTIYAAGLAVAHALTTQAEQPQGNKPRVLLGRDTRESGPWIAATFAAGLRAGGADVESAGIVPTPAIAYLARTHNFAAGAVLSASHNPWHDNGIKLFGGDGYKLPDSVELDIETEILRRAAEVAAPENPGPILDNTQYRDDYIAYLLAQVPGLDLSETTLVADCANGAASAIAPELFAKLNARATLENITPTGRNINENCGALHPEIVAAETARLGASIGLTFDGDADRCLLASRDGRVLNGDAILLAAARDLAARNLLTNNLVVATTMSNMGLEAALKRSGITMLRAAVGDRYVLEMMRQRNAALGGEQSGHILFPHLSTTGDGLLTALVILDLVSRTGKRIDELAADLKVFPQVILNVKVREKLPLDQFPAIASTIEQAEQELADTGRVVIRYSGTEPLARVMIEAEDEARMRHHAESIATAIRSALGV